MAMPFATSLDADVRLLSNTSPLTREEVRDLMQWMNQISTGGIRRLEAELALQSIQAVQKFETSSTRLTFWLIVLTAVLVALTGVISYFTVLLAGMPKA